MVARSVAARQASALSRTPSSAQHFGWYIYVCRCACVCNCGGGVGLCGGVLRVGELLRGCELAYARVGNMIVMLYMWNKTHIHTRSNINLNTHIPDCVPALSSGCCSCVYKYSWIHDSKHCACILDVQSMVSIYGVAGISRLLKIVRFFCKRAL